MSKENKPQIRTGNLVVQKLNQELLIYDLIENKAFCLNKTSALVWQLCDGDKSVSEISRLVGKKLRAPADENIVWLALDQLKRENLLEAGAPLSPFEGLNRREVIRKVGLASMVTLPLVMSVIAPTAAFAQSQSCINPNGLPPGSQTSATSVNAASCCNILASTCCAGSFATCTFNSQTNTCSGTCGTPICVNPGGASPGTLLAGSGGTEAACCANLRSLCCTGNSTSCNFDSQTTTCPGLCA